MLLRFGFCRFRAHCLHGAIFLQIYAKISVLFLSASQKGRTARVFMVEKIAKHV
jgi:hypothetical protein